MTAQGPMERGLAAALKVAQVQARDRAAAQLARRYAQLLDAARGQPNESEVYADLGPKLLATLTALGMTAAGRGVRGGVGGGPPVGKLDELRARAAARRTGTR